ncbi:metallophosphoesterase [Radiobacillus kanasensis]|uniref:metallophosphoesterase n=1 Tax=Radiobacillus kanasensis TaxID=2844358 RepID=UPI001E478356|nr:metallophosphoesterase [Radiobacillus kanasensis]UFU01218.1 metallophosphoesterase [Radiobacillus kanasensis]
MKKTLKRSAILITSLLIIVLIWGICEPFFIKIEREKAFIPNLPKVWENETIAVIGDFQVGMWMDNTKTVKRAAEKVVELNPGIVLILGDFLYHPETESEAKMKAVTQLLQPLVSADIPVFTVLGNHDYGMNDLQDAPKTKIATRLELKLENLGITVLQNETMSLLKTNENITVGEPSPHSLYLAGIGATWAERAYPKKVFQHIPDALPRVVMMHNPDAFKKIPAQLAPLAIAGHTHGSQINIPYFSTWLFKTVLKDEKVHSSGWIKGFGSNGNRLYINRGIGFSNVPIRINCPPEITVFELLRG